MKHLPEDVGAPFSTRSSPDTSASSNNGAHLARLGPTMGGGGASMVATSGIGVTIRVTLRACSRVVGRGTAFPFDAALLGWVGGLTGAMGRAPRRASGTDVTTN